MLSTADQMVFTWKRSRGTLPLHTMSSMDCVLYVYRGVAGVFSLLVNATMVSWCELGYLGGSVVHSFALLAQ